MSEVSVTVTTTAHVVCPKCGECIKVKIVGLSKHEPPEEEDEVRAARQVEREKILGILQKEYPAIDTWQCWQALKGSK